MALANGTLRGAIELARERGAGNREPAALADLWQARATSAELIEDGLRWGVRHARVTAIEPRPRLALLANDVSDAIDPAFRNLQNSNHRSPVDPLDAIGQYADNSSLLAQIRLRAAMQPWVDLPIAYPLLACAQPSPEEIGALSELPGKYGLPPLRFRHVDFSLSERLDQHGK
jgi:ribonucleoside-diphosphate reductase alpha chain